MKTYVVQPVTGASVVAIVIATSWENPFDDLPALEQELAGMAGPILFDLLCAVGPAHNRFLTAWFDGRRLVPQSVKPVTQLDPVAASVISSYYRTHPDPFSASVLSAYDRWLLQIAPLAPLDATG